MRAIISYRSSPTVLHKKCFTMLLLDENLEFSMVSYTMMFLCGGFNLLLFLQFESETTYTFKSKSHVWCPFSVSKKNNFLWWRISKSRRQTELANVHNMLNCVYEDVFISFSLPLCMSLRGDVQIKSHILDRAKPCLRFTFSLAFCNRIGVTLKLL